VIFDGSGVTASSRITPLSCAMPIASRKRAHHRPLFGQVIHDEHSSRERLGQSRQAGKVTRLALFVEADHRLGPELPLLGDEQRGLQLIRGRLSVPPERVRGAKPLLRGHPLPQA